MVVLTIKDNYSHVPSYRTWVTRCTNAHRRPWKSPVCISDFISLIVRKHSPAHLILPLKYIPMNTIIPYLSQSDLPSLGGCIFKTTFAWGTCTELVLDSHVCVWGMSAVLIKGNVQRLSNREQEMFEPYCTPLMHSGLGWNVLKALIISISIGQWRACCAYLGAHWQISNWWLQRSHIDGIQS